MSISEQQYNEPILHYNKMIIIFKLQYNEAFTELQFSVT